MGSPRPTGDAIDALLVELCVDFGFCLPPDDEQRLRDSPPDDVDGFTDAVMNADRMDPSLHEHLRRQVREVVAKWFVPGDLTGVPEDPGRGQSR
jgi:hypothetical protein